MHVAVSTWTEWPDGRCARPPRESVADKGVFDVPTSTESTSKEEPRRAITEFATRPPNARRSKTLVQHKALQRVRSGEEREGLRAGPLRSDGETAAFIC